MIIRKRKSQNSDTKNNSISNYLDNFLKILFIATPFLGLSALAHEWGYYSTFGIDLSLVPIGAADQFKNILALIPSVLARLTFLYAFLLLLFLPKIDSETYRKTGCALGFFGLIIFAGYLLFSNKQILRLEGFDVIITSALIFFLSKELGASNKRIKYQTALVVFIISIPFWLFTIGQTAALDFKHESPQIYIHEKTSQTLTSPIKAILLRSYEKQLFVINENQIPTFRAMENIESIEVIQKPKKYGLLCQHGPKICL